MTPPRQLSIRRSPSVESTNIYPGLVVCDDRVSGSITIGRTRLPMWAMTADVVQSSWGWAAENYDAQMSAEDASMFFHALVQHRGEFGRLILELAAAERAELVGGGLPWWQAKLRRRRVRAQLLRCAALLED